MNKFQRKMFIGAMFEWFILLTIFTVWLIIEIIYFDNVIKSVIEAGSYGTFDQLLMVFVFTIPLMSIPAIIFKVIIPCYKGILKGEIW